MDAASEFEMVFQSAFAPLALAEIPPLARLVSSELVELGRRLLEAHFGALTVPAMPVEHLLHFAVRKRFFEDQARAGLAGVAHVVSLGAGWDPLLLALAQAHPEVAFTEFDRPEVCEPKRSALVKAGLLPSNLHLVSTVLPDLGAWPAGPHLMLAQAVLMYLEVAQVRQLLQRLPPGRLVLSYATSDLGDPSLARLRRFIGWHCDDLPDFLGPDWQILEHPTHAELEQRYLRPGLRLSGPGRVERMAVVHRQRLLART
ncbi:MAG: class I SAM-dependent methyltransferase [Vulcanimicrobiota bacterium]